MRLSAMRRMASLTLALVWGAARLAQPLQPECPHHAVAAATSAEVATSVAADPHAHHHAGAPESIAPSAEPAEPHPGQQPAGHGAPCECAAHCCAASAVALVAGVPIVAGAALWPAPAPVVFASTGAPRARLSHRQPPATAPPTTVAV